LAQCTHANLDFVGEQKTENGVNTYFKCKGCGEVIVTTPDKKAYGIKSRS